MKILLSLITFFTLSVYSVFAQNDTMYVMKDGVVINKQSIKPSDMDSIIFYSPSIIKEDKEEPGTIKDVDGNVYKTVTIGTQTWMAENLRVTKYNDGTEISLVTDNVEWLGLSADPRYCYYNNDISYKSVYGIIYNGYVMKSGKNICPTGWHVPSKAEWTTLSDYSDSGKKLMSINFYREGAGGTDDFGFSAVQAGYRSGSGNFGIYGANWLSEWHGVGLVWTYHLYGEGELLIREGYQGYSVRCIQD